MSIIQITQLSQAIVSPQYYYLIIIISKGTKYESFSRSLWPLEKKGLDILSGAVTLH